MKNPISINRRKFVKLSAAVVAVSGTSAYIPGTGFEPDSWKTAKPAIKLIPKEDTKDVFKKCGACSHTFFYILNREFGYPKPVEESASDPLAGGLMLGHQCGMLWGSALATGAESFRRNSDQSLAVATTIQVTRQISDSFYSRAGSLNCNDITGVNLKSKLGIAKMMVQIIFQGGLRNSKCFKLADKWAPEAIECAYIGLAHSPADIPHPCLSCASEVVKRRGGSEEEIVMASGFAGGIGLSGLACGALGAAIWMDTLTLCRKNPGKPGFEFGSSNSPEIIKAFNTVTQKEILCSKITGKYFNTIREHSDFIKEGGCRNLINVLSGNNYELKNE